MVFPYFLNTKQVANYVRATFMWRLRELVHPPQLLPKEYRSLYLNFDLEVTEASARDFHIPELT